MPDIDLFLFHYCNRNLKWFEIYYKNLLHEFNLKKEFKPEFYLLQIINNLIEVRKNFEKFSEKEFLDYYKNKIKDKWQIEKPGYHRNWYNYHRLSIIIKILFP